MSASLASYLPDFSETQVVPLPIMPDDFDDEPISAEAVEPPLDIEAERAKAYAEEHEAAAEDLRRQYDAERQELEKAHAEQLAALKEKHETETVALIAAQFRDVAAATAQALADQTAVILSPLLEEALTAKAVAEMADMIREAMVEGELGTLTVRGPAGLFERLETALGETSAVLRHIEADDLDIAVEMGESALVTRMSAWSASLKKVMA